MAGTTALQVTLQNTNTGNCRYEVCTCTPADPELTTWLTSGQKFLLIAPEGERIIDIQANGDGTTTVKYVKATVDGQDIRCKWVLTFLINTYATLRIPAPVVIKGNRQLALTVSST